MMIQQNWNINEDEKNRILNLHESATKNLYLLEQTSVVVGTKTKTENKNFPTTKLGDKFEFGKYESESVKKSLSDLKPQIEKFIKDSDSSKFIVNISAGESQVTNPKGFEEKGSLALARANSIKNYFEELFSELIKQGTLIINSPKNTSEVTIGKTPYNRLQSQSFKEKYDKEYSQEQFVDFDIVGTGQIKKKTKNFCNFSQDANGAVATPESGFEGYNYNLDISSVSTGKLLTVLLDPLSVPDLLVVTLGNEIKSSGFVGEGSEDNLAYLATILGNQYLLKGKSIPSMFPSDIIPMSVEEAKELFYNNDKLKKNLKHVLTNVDWYKPKDVIYQSIKFYKFKTNPVKNKKGVISFAKPEGVSEINIKVYSPIGSTLWSLKGSCR